MYQFVARALQNQFIPIIFLLVLGWFLFEIRSILVTVFIAIVIMAALSPFVDALRGRRVPNVVAACITYFIALSLVFALLLPLIPFFASQVHSFFFSLPYYLENAASNLGVVINGDEIQGLVRSELDTVGRNAVTVTTRFFGGLFTTLTVLVLSFYLLLDKENVRRSLVTFFPKHQQKKAQSAVHLIEEKLGAWFRGQILLSLAVGVLTWIALTMLQIEFALPLAVVAGILEILPTIGPTIAAVPAVIVGLTISPTIAGIIVLIYMGIQLLENNILVPHIMHKAVGLNPIVIIIAVMIGAKLMGVVGALLAIPFLSALVILYAVSRNE